jgi:glycosyltransferase involved in cell wall biosynthesis
MPRVPSGARFFRSLRYTAAVRIAYATNVRLPSERAHGHQIAQVCDALAALGHDVTLLAPYRRNTVTQDYWSYYDADKRVKLTHLGSFDPIGSPLPGVTKLWTLNWMLRGALSKLPLQQDFDLLYTRSPALLPALLGSGVPVVLELHQLPRLNKKAFIRNCNGCARVACLTSSMKESLIAWGVDSAKVIAEGDAVDLKRFGAVPSVRTGSAVAKDRLVVGYVGRLKTLGMEKGVGVLLQALALLKQEGGFFGLVVGGPETDRKEYETQAKALGLTSQDVHFTGAVDAKEVPAMLGMCDILAMPFPDLPHYRHHMSPLKMFEYMAADRPLVTSDLPTVRDVLSEKTAVFCEPGSAQSLADALRWIAAHGDEAKARAKAARALVEHHTWEERMKRVLADITPR